MTWSDIKTAPPLDRILVCGWQPQRRGVQGYWWYYEDQTDENGVPMDHPYALRWMPWPAAPINPPE